MVIQESGEMYLETIRVLQEKNGHVRSTDIADYMGYSKPSVSRAMGLLKQGGYVEADENGHLTLTESGLATAREVFERHTLLTKMLMALGVSEEVATEDACKIEHVISAETIEALKKHWK